MKKTFARPATFIAASATLALFILSACTQAPPPVSEEEKTKAVELAKTVYKAIMNSPAAMAAAGVKLEDGFCLADGLMKDWVADLVHNPRQPVDDDPKNQCPSFRTGKAQHFVELDLDGNLVRAQ